MSREKNKWWEEGERKLSHESPIPARPHAFTHAWSFSPSPREQASILTEASCRQTGLIMNSATYQYLKHNCNMAAGLKSLGIQNTARWLRDGIPENSEWRFPKIVSLASFFYVNKIFQMKSLDFHLWVSLNFKFQNIVTVFWRSINPVLY